MNDKENSDVRVTKFFWKRMHIKADDYTAVDEFPL